MDSFTILPSNSKKGYFYLTSENCPHEPENFQHFNFKSRGYTKLREKIKIEGIEYQNQYELFLKLRDLPVPSVIYDKSLNEEDNKNIKDAFERKLDEDIEILTLRVQQKHHKSQALLVNDEKRKEVRIIYSIDDHSDITYFSTLVVKHFPNFDEASNWTTTDEAKSNLPSDEVNKIYNKLQGLKNIKQRVNDVILSQGIIAVPSLN